MVLGAQKIPIHIGKKDYVLTPMAGQAVLDWAEIQLLAASQKARALMLVKQKGEEGVREALRLVYLAQAALVAQALGCSHKKAVKMSVGDQQRVIELQDGLNRVDVLYSQIGVESLAEQAYLG